MTHDSPDGVRDHVKDHEHARVDDPARSSEHDRVERLAEPIGERDEPKRAQRLEGTGEARETAEKDQTCRKRSRSSRSARRSRLAIDIGITGLTRGRVDEKGDQQEDCKTKRVESGYVLRRMPR